MRCNLFSEELSSVETCLYVLLTLSTIPVSEELSSVETWGMNGMAWDLY